MQQKFSFSRFGAMVLSLLGLFMTNGKAQTITTYAGGIGDGQNAATYGRLFGPMGMAADGAGNIYFMDYDPLLGDYSYRLRKINSAGVISTYAGNSNVFGGSGYGFGGTAIDASFQDPQGVATDATGNVYVSFTNSVAKISSSGLFTLVAGGFAGGGFAGDGSAATGALLEHPMGMIVDASGNLFIADNANNRVRKVNTSGIITTVAGGGSVLGDGGLAVSALLNGPTGVAVDASGNLYICDGGNNRIRKVNTSGIISTICGTGACCSFSGAGGLATAAVINDPSDIKIDGAGNVYFSDYGVPYICKISTSGILTTLAGTGSGGFSGDGGPASSAKIKLPRGIALDASGNIFFADYGNVRIREINTSGIISTITGGNGLGDQGFSGDGGSALLAEFNTAGGAWTDVAGNVYVADGGNSRIRKISTSGIVSTWAGGAVAGYGGDGGMATAAELNNPAGGVVDKFGNTYIADYGTNHVRKISPSGIITTVAGGGSSGLGDGGPATAAVISASGVGVDTSGNIYIADGTHNRVRKVNVSTGIITTIAGTGVFGHTGDGGPGTAAEIYSPYDVKVDKFGNIYIADDMLHKIDASGTITTIPGAYAGSLAIDNAGNVYFTNSSDGYFSMISRYDVYGYVSVVAGNGQSGYAGEGVAATACEFASIKGIALDTAGHMYIDDMGATIRGICCFSTIVDHPPVFTHGTPAAMAACASSGPVSIDTFLSISDADAGSTEMWTVITAPTHGTLGGFPASGLSTGGTITPSGLTFTPAPGYVGVDHFVIKISDGEDTAAITINLTISPIPATGTITGATAVCPGGTATLSESVAGGVWSSSNTALATIGSTGIVTGIAPGTDTIIYTETFSCGSALVTQPLTVNPAPAAITGSPAVCVSGADTLTDVSSGGTWTSGSPATATIGSGSGYVSGVVAGTAVVTYTLPTGCFTVATVSVNPMPDAGTISGTAVLCAGAATTLADGTGSGTWSSSSALATVAGGVVTAVNAGTDTILYSVTNSCGSAVAMQIMTINPLPVIMPVSGGTTLPSGGTSLLTDPATGGTWASSNILVATIDPTGLVTGLDTGTATITYTLTNTFGCTSETTIVVTVTVPTLAGSPVFVNGFYLYPNPAYDMLTIVADNTLFKSYTITNQVGQVLAAGQVTGAHTTADIRNLPAGMYYISLDGDDGSKATKFVKQ